MPSILTVTFTEPPVDGKADGLDVRLNEATKAVDYFKDSGGVTFAKIKGVGSAHIVFSKTQIPKGGIVKYTFTTVGNDPRVEEAHWKRGENQLDPAAHTPKK